RYTQRNLYATLRYLDASNPEASPLVALPQHRHGNSLAAVFDKHSANQLAELVSWAKMTVAPSAMMASSHPATIAPPETTLSQPPLANGPAPSWPASESSIRVMRPPLEQPTGAPDAATKQAPPRDRFDPEIFNRRYHGK